MLIPIQFFSKFNEVIFYEDTHTYIVDSEKYTSVTTFLKNVENEFDEDYWSEYKAKELGVSKEEILAEWKYKNEKSKVKGSSIHSFAENYILNKIFNNYLHDDVNKYEGLLDEIDVCKKQFINFYNDSLNKLIPIKSEMVVFDREYKISGMIDQIFYNTKSKKLEIWDWKTNKKITLNNRYNKLKSPVEYLDDCKFNLYSLQLNFYKFILSKNIPEIEIGNMYFVHFNEEIDNYKIYKCLDLQDKVKEIIVKYKK